MTLSSINLEFKLLIKKEIMLLFKIYLLAWGNLIARNSEVSVQRFPTLRAS